MENKKSIITVGAADTSGTSAKLFEQVMNEQVSETLMIKSFARLVYENGMGHLTIMKLERILRRAEKYPEQLTTNEKEIYGSYLAYKAGKEQAIKQAAKPEGSIKKTVIEIKED